MFKGGPIEPRRFVLLGILLQFAILVTMTGLAARPLLIGDTGLLRVVPVDPRDVFRGDYVTLSYEGINTNNRKFPPSTTDKALFGHAVYVPLAREADGRHWQPGKITLERPKSGAYLRGTLR